MGIVYIFKLSVCILLFSWLLTSFDLIIVTHVLTPQYINIKYSVYIMFCPQTYTHISLQDQRLDLR